MKGLVRKHFLVKRRVKKLKTSHYGQDRKIQEGLQIGRKKIHNKKKNKRKSL